MRVSGQFPQKFHEQLYAFSNFWGNELKMNYGNMNHLIIYHLLTESEVITGESQTEALMY